MNTAEPAASISLNPLPAYAKSEAREIAAARRLVPSGRNWTAWFGPFVSLAILVVIFLRIGRIEFQTLLPSLPNAPLFWLVFAVTYISTPLFDWIIFRKLWSIKADGIAALFQKRVTNELLLGYVGDVYFYTWARRNVKMAGSPFGAVKDSAILSGVMGNFVTLAMVVLTLPIIGSLRLAIDGRTLAISLVTLVATSFLPLIFQRRVFSLPAPDRRMVASVHLVRIVSNVLLYAYVWHLLLPGVALSWWLMLSTLRLVLSRLPLIPNKDVLFAGAAVFLIGRDQEIAAALALIAGLLLLTHLLVGLGLSLSGLLRAARVR